MRYFKHLSQNFPVHLWLFSVFCNCRLSINILISCAFYFLITFFTITQPAFSQSLSVNCPLEIAESWKEHFPFDLIYPVGKLKQPETKCPQLVFFGEKREVCSVLVITKVAKACFLFKVVFQSLINL